MKYALTLVAGYYLPSVAPKIAKLVIDISFI
jgi:hypothetical protein